MRGACGCNLEKNCKCFPSDENLIDEQQTEIDEQQTEPDFFPGFPGPIQDHFPILVEILEGGDVGKFKLIKKAENLPLGLSFKIHLCNVSDELFYAFELGRSLTRKQEKF